MRILIVQAAFGAGGAEKVVAMIANHWASTGHRVDVLGLNAETTGSYFDYDPRVNLHAGRRSSGSWGKARDVVRVRRAATALAPDIVVSFLTKVNAICALALAGTGIPLVVSERNNPRMQGGSRFWRHAGRWAARQASAPVMQTRAALEELPSEARKRALVIPNPCEAADLPAPDSGQTDPAQTFVAAGRLDRQKGFDELIAAFARVARSHPKARLTIHGEGPERGALQDAVQEYGLEDRVALPGLSVRPGAWLDDGGMFVLSSRYEGYPNALMEAMTAGLPVIARDCPWGPAEMIDPGRNGLLVQGQGIGDLADAMTTLCDDADLRRDLATAARADAGRWAPARIFAQWDDLLARVTASA